MREIRATSYAPRHAIVRSDCAAGAIERGLYVTIYVTNRHTTDSTVKLIEFVFSLFSSFSAMFSDQHLSSQLLTKKYHFSSTSNCNRFDYIMNSSLSHGHYDVKDLSIH